MSHDSSIFFRTELCVVVAVIKRRWLSLIVMTHLHNVNIRFMIHDVKVVMQRVMWLAPLVLLYPHLLGLNVDLKSSSFNTSKLLIQTSAFPGALLSGPALSIRYKTS